MASTRITAQALIAFISIPFTLNAQTAPIVLLDEKFEEGAEALFRSDPFLLQMGGAKVIEYKGSEWFVAVGIITIKESSAKDPSRLLHLGKIKAQLAALEFTKPNEITTNTTLKEETTIKNSNGVKTATSIKMLDEKTQIKIKSVWKALPTLGTWKSADGKLFFYAVGIKL